MYSTDSRRGETRLAFQTRGRSRTSRRRSKVCFLPLACRPDIDSVLGTLLTNFFFDGARADLSKSLSVNPIFQVTHSFALGSQTAAPSYNFGAVFANNNVSCPLLLTWYRSRCCVQVFLQGSVDHEGNVNGRLNQGWSANNVTKAQCQVRVRGDSCCLSAV